MTDDIGAVAESSIAISAGSFNGSGTVVRRTQHNSYVLTCWHIVANSHPSDMSVVYRTGKTFHEVKAKLERKDAANDLALLRTARVLPIDPISIAKEEPDLYDSVISVGCHNGAYGIGSVGHIVGKDGLDKNAEKQYSFTGLVAPGLSGGTLANIDCELIGVPVKVDMMGYIPLTGLGFAVPLPIIRRFLRMR